MPHPFALVGQYLASEWAAAGIPVRFRDAPYFNPDWKPAAGLLVPRREALLNSLRPPAPGERFDPRRRPAVAGRVDNLSRNPRKE